MTKYRDKKFWPDSDNIFLFNFTHFLKFDHFPWYTCDNLSAQLLGNTALHYYRHYTEVI